MDLRGIESICGSFRSRLRLLQVQGGIARAAIVGLALLPAFLALDWWVHLSSTWRLLGLIVFVAALGATLWFTLLKQLSRSWSNKEILTYVDATLPQGQGVLLELYELVEGEGIQETATDTGRGLADEAIADLGDLAKQTRLALVFQTAKARRWLIAGLVMCLLFGAAFVAKQEYVLIGCQRFFNPFSSAYWPHRTNIEIAEPANGWSIPQMENFMLEATVSGVVPPQITVAYQSETTGYWIKDKVDVKKGLINYEFKEVHEPLKFYLSGGDFDTNIIPIKIIERPYIKGIAAKYEYPIYAGIPNKEEQTGQLRGLEGTQVTLTLTTSIPVKKALFFLNEEAPEELKFTTETTLEKKLMLSKSGSYTIQLFDKNGFREPTNKPERYEIQVTPDEPPVLEVLSPASDLSVTRNVAVNVSFKARDDFGLKKLTVEYQINEGALTPLSDRITGPIVQTGLQSKVDFRWDLRRMENLPEQGTVNVVITAQDVNPTGRGVDKKTFQINLVKISEFHRKSIADAQEIMREALNAYNRQWDAMQKAQQLQSGGSGKLDDPLWREMTESQNGAEQSARKMASLMAELTASYETNHLEHEFMANRLKQITELLNKVTGSAGSELSKISDVLRKARPAGSADEVAERLKASRGNAAGAIKDGQKLTVLYLERIISKAYDWRDLQSTTIETTLLFEDESEVKKDVEKIAPKFEGKERADLADADLTDLEKIATRQRGLFDSESKLEAALAEMINAAKKQQRKNIVPLLESPFTLLRTNRTKDMLDEAAKKIADNRPFAIKDELNKALQILGAVKAGLLIAGEKTDDKEEQITIALPVTTKRDFEAVQETEKKPDAEDTVASTVETTTTSNPQNLLSVLPAGQDRLSQVIMQTAEAARTAASRTTYLSQKRPDGEMPRCMKLNYSRGRELQGAVTSSLKRAIGDAVAPNIPPFMNEELTSALEPAAKLEELSAASDVSPLTQQMQDDFIRGMDDLVQYIAYQKKIVEATAENKKGNGEDSHQVKFLLREKNLDAVESALRDLRGITLVEKRISRNVTRFLKTPAQGPLQSAIEKGTREHSSADQKKIAGLMDSAVITRMSGLSADVAPRVSEAGFASLQALKLAPLSTEIAGGSADKELSGILNESCTAMDAALLSLLDVLEERVKPVVVDTPKTEDKAISQAEFEKSHSAASLIERIKASTSLPPAIKEKILLELSRNLPPKYKELLTAYYSSCIPAEEKP